MDYTPNINDFERCPVCGKLFDCSILSEVIIHMHGDAEISEEAKKIRGKRVDEKSLPE